MFRVLGFGFRVYGASDPCFSQGGIFLRHAHRIMFDVDRAAFAEAAAGFPKFAICIASMWVHVCVGDVHVCVGVVEWHECVRVRCMCLLSPL